MTNKLIFSKSDQVFTNELFGKLTTYTDQNNNVWFIGKEVAKKLGYIDPDQSIRQHCKHALKQRIKANQYDRVGNSMWLINEADLYRLIIRSNLPAAEKFENWVVEEVLPTIRKTGGYGLDQQKFSRISDAEYNGKFGTLCSKLNNRDKIIASQIKTCEALHGLTPKGICQEHGVKTARGSADELSRMARTAIEDMVALAPDEDIEKTVIAAAEMVLNLINKGNKLPYVPTAPTIEPRMPRAKLTIQLELF